MNGCRRILVYPISRNDTLIVVLTPRDQPYRSFLERKRMVEQSSKFQSTLWNGIIFSSPPFFLVTVQKYYYYLSRVFLYSFDKDLSLRE